MAAKDFPKGHKDIELTSPIKVSGADVTKLRMREPKVRDQLFATKASKDAIEQELTLFANLCEVTPKDIEELSLRDYGKLQDAYRAFTE